MTILRRRSRAACERALRSGEKLACAAPPPQHAWRPPPRHALAVLDLVAQVPEATREAAKPRCEEQARATPRHALVELHHAVLGHLVALHQLVELRGQHGLLEVHAVRKHEAEALRRSGAPARGANLLHVDDLRMARRRQRRDGCAPRRKRKGPPLRAARPTRLLPPHACSTGCIPRWLLTTSSRMAPRVRAGPW